MRLRRKQAIVAALAACAVVASACGTSGTKYLTSPQLATKIIPAPGGFQVDATKGASGQMSPQQFTTYGGYQSAREAGFEGGFTQAYNNPNTSEEIIITVIEFSKPKQATAYYRAESHKVLDAADPTYRPMPRLSGATEVFATKEYGGNYVHAASDATGLFYFQIVYEDGVTATVPIEFTLYAQSEWTLLQPGVSLPARSTATTRGE